MSIDLSAINSGLIKIGAGNDIKKPVDDSATMFEDFYNAAVGLYEKTNEAQLNSEKIQTEFATGETDDVLSLVLAQNRAHSTMQFTVQVTNKIIEAYKEIMRMQV